MKLKIRRISPEGYVYIDFNQELLVPPFGAFRPDLSGPRLITYNLTNMGTLDQEYWGFYNFGSL